MSRGLKDKFFGRTPDVNAHLYESPHSEIDNLIAYADLESVMVQIYGPNWKELHLESPIGEIGSMGRIHQGGAQPIITSKHLRKPLIPEFTQKGTSSTIGHKPKYTTTASFPMELSIGNMYGMVKNQETGGYDPGYVTGEREGFGTSGFGDPSFDYYSATGTGDTEKAALENAKMIAQLSAIFNPQGFETEAPVATEETITSTPLSRGKDSITAIKNQMGKGFGDKENQTILMLLAMGLLSGAGKAKSKREDSSYR